jgi:hypothetical protein
MANVKVGLGLDRNQPESLHVGDNVLICKVSLSASWSSGDVHLIGKLPQGAIPLEAVWYPGTAFAATGIAKFGTSASQELFLASDSYAESGVMRYDSVRKLGTAMQISLSDDARVLYEYITMVATAGVSIGFVGDLVVRYKLPGQTV